jgi:hypothetical protein
MTASTRGVSMPLMRHLLWEYCEPVRVASLTHPGAYYLPTYRLIAAPSITSIVIDAYPVRGRFGRSTVHLAYTAPTSTGSLERRTRWESQTRTLQTSKASADTNVSVEAIPSPDLRPVSPYSVPELGWKGDNSRAYCVRVALRRILCTWLLALTGHSPSEVY